MSTQQLEKATQIRTIGDKYFFNMVLSIPVSFLVSLLSNRNIAAFSRSHPLTVQDVCYVVVDVYCCTVAAGHVELKTAAHPTKTQKSFLEFPLTCTHRTKLQDSTAQ